MLAHGGFEDIRTHDDLSSRPRVTLGRLHSHPKEHP
jgi:hypothetical protein